MKKKAVLILLCGLTSATLLLAGCARTFTVYSNTFIKPVQPITEMKVLYLENRFASIDLEMIGYTDLPELFRERVPIVLGMNNVSNDYATFQKKDFGQKEEINTVKWSNIGNANSLLLIIQVIDGMVVRGSKTPTTITLNMHANLIDTKTNSRMWTGQFRNRFMQPPIGRAGFENEFVDNLLKTILEQMAKDGIINLKDGKALIPLPKKESNKGNSGDSI